MRCRASATAEYVSREVIDNEVDLVLHVGDISYANGDPEVAPHTPLTPPAPPTQSTLFDPGPCPSSADCLTDPVCLLMCCFLFCQPCRCCRDTFVHCMLGTKTRLCVETGALSIASICKCNYTLSVASACKCSCNFYGACSHSLDSSVAELVLCHGD